MDKESKNDCFDANKQQAKIADLIKCLQNPDPQYRERVLEDICKALYEYIKGVNTISCRGHLQHKGRLNALERRLNRLEHRSGGSSYKKVA